MSSLTYSIIPPPFASRSDQYGVLNLSIKKFTIGKLSSILFSDIPRISIVPLIWSQLSTNSFQSEFIFTWAKMMVLFVCTCVHCSLSVAYKSCVKVFMKRKLWFNNLAVTISQLKSNLQQLKSNFVNVQVRSH